MVIAVVTAASGLNVMAPVAVNCTLWAVMIKSSPAASPPAALRVSVPVVVVESARFPDVELMDLVPAPANSMELPVPAFSTCRTLPVEEA